jgi:hypothetical protein
MLICLMSLKNQVVYIQFHPVAYMVKLNIEMSMASLIKKLAKASVDDRDRHNIESMNNIYSLHDHTSNQTATASAANKLKSGNHTSASVARLGRPGPAAKDFDGIHTTTEVHVKVEQVPSDAESVSDVGIYDGFDRRHHGSAAAVQGQQRRSDDELPLSPSEMAVKQYETHAHVWNGGS